MGGSYYPTLYYLDANGKKLGEHDPYTEKTVETLRQSLAAAKRAAELRAKDDLPKEERAELFLLDAELLMMDWPEAKERAAALGELPPETAAKVRDILVNDEVADLMKPPPRTAQDRIDLGADFADMAAEGKVPTKPNLARNFWIYQLVRADAEENADAYALALEGVKKTLGAEERYAPLIQRYEARLEALRSASGTEKEPEKPSGD